MRPQCVCEIQERLQVGFRFLAEYYRITYYLDCMPPLLAERCWLARILFSVYPDDWLKGGEKPLQAFLRESVRTWLLWRAPGEAPVPGNPHFKGDKLDVCDKCDKHFDTLLHRRACQHQR